MIARGQNAPAALTESGDRDAIIRGEAAANIDAEQPELIEVGIVEFRQGHIVAGGGALAIPRDDMILSLAAGIGHVTQKIGQHGEAADGPIIFGGRDGGLQKDLFHFGHPSIWSA